MGDHGVTPPSSKDADVDVDTDTKQEEDKKGKDKNEIHQQVGCWRIVRGVDGGRVRLGVNWEGSVACGGEHSLCLCLPSF